MGSLIGDSWVVGRKLDRVIEQTMTISGLEVEVISSGHPGARSRQIYRNLFLESNAEHSSNNLLMEENVDYLVVVADVNDSVGHVGGKFYAHHMLLIIQTALARGITPVIVEVPEYGIEETSSVGLLSWGKRAMYLWFFDNGNENAIREYREALREKISPDVANKVLFVNFSPITDDYKTAKHLYANLSHLNNDGYSKLGDLIAKWITEWHINAKRSEGNSAALRSLP